MIKHVFHSIPIHIMAVISPPSTTIKFIDSLISNFFWGKDHVNKKYHWASMETLSIPQAEGGIGIRRITVMYCFTIQTVVAI